MKVCAMCGQSLANHTRQATTKGRKATATHSIPRQKQLSPRPKARRTATPLEQATKPTNPPPKSQKARLPKLKKPVVVEAQATEPVAIDKLPQKTHNAAIGAKPKVAVVRPPKQRTAHGAESKPRMKPKARAKKKAVRGVSTGAARRVETRLDRAADLERRITKLEQIVSVIGDGTDADGRAHKTANLKREPQKVPHPKPDKPIIVGAQVAKAAAIREVQENKHNAVSGAGATATAVRPPTENMARGGLCKATMKAKVRAKKKVVRRVSTRAPKRVETRPDRAAKLERRIAKLERTVWGNTDGTDADRQAGKTTNVKREPQKSLPSRPNKPVIVDAKVAKAAAIDQSVRTKRDSALRAKGEASLGPRQKKKLRPRPKARRKATPLELAMKSMNPQTKPQAARHPKPNRPVVVEANASEPVVIDEPPQYKHNGALEADTTPRPVASAEKKEVLETSSKEAPDPQALAPKEQSDETGVFDEPASKTVILHELPEHPQEATPSADTTLCPLVSAGKAMGIEEPSAKGQSDKTVVCEETTNRTVIIHELPTHPQEATLKADPTPRSVASAEKKVALEDPSDETPDPYALAPKGIVGDIPTHEAERFEDGVDSAVGLECQAERVPEWISRAETGIGPGGQAGRPTDQNQRPRKQVLIIDDDATMRMLLKMGLGSHEYDCLTAENGKAAQAVLQAHHPDLILVDLMMPVMDGLTFIQWLRHTAQDSTPVLVFTNVNTPKVTQEALASGANSFACKPLHLKELLEVMNELVPD